MSNFEFEEEDGYCKAFDAYCQDLVILPTYSSTGFSSAASFQSHVSVSELESESSLSSSESLEYFDESSSASVVSDTSSEFSCAFSEFEKDDNHKKQYTIMDLIAKNCTIHEESAQVFLSDVNEDIATEQLGNDEFFGMFGDIKKIEIIRDKRSRKIMAEITFYASESTVEIRKLASVYQSLTDFKH